MSRGSLTGMVLVTRMPLKGRSCLPGRLRSRTRKLEMDAFQQLSDLSKPRDNPRFEPRVQMMTRLSSAITKYVIDGHRGRLPRKGDYTRPSRHVQPLFQLSPFLFLIPIPIFILTYQQCLNEPPYYQALSTDNLSLPGERSRAPSRTTSLPSLSESRSLRPRVLLLPASFREYLLSFLHLHR
jgi:hypothetical protein